MSKHQITRTGSTWYGSLYQCRRCGKTTTAQDVSTLGLGVTIEEMKADALSQIDDIQEEVEQRMGWCSDLDKKEEAK